MPNERLRIAIGAVIAVLLQVLLAPAIAIYSAVPNFLIVYTLLIAMVVPDEDHYVLAFVMGLTSDLLGYGPVGALAFLLILASFAASRLHAAFANGTVFVPLIVMVVTIALVELLYAVFVIGFGAGLSVFDAFVYRALPTTLYDCVLGILLYPLLSRLFSASPMAVESVSTGPHMR